MFENDYKKKLERLLKLYYNVKSLIIYVEEISGETYPQILLEQRDTLDHIMRALNRLIGAKPSDEDAEYILTNLDKAYAHLYRAGYDALDWAGVTLRDLIGEQLIDITPPTITQVFPEYYRKIKPRILEISEQIAKLRETKDIGAPNLDSFNEYLKLIEELKGYYQKIIKIRSSLIEVEKHSRKSNIKYWVLTATLTIAGAIIGAIIAWYLTKSTSTPTPTLTLAKLDFSFSGNVIPFLKCFIRKRRTKLTREYSVNFLID